MPLFAISSLHLAAEEQLAAFAAPSPPAVSKPTGATLEKWLEGKDVVEVCFAGPHLEPQKLKSSLQTKELDNALDESFFLTPGEGGGENRSFVTVVMNVSPENIQRLSLLQKELAPRGYPLDPGNTYAWSFQCAPEIRRQVRDMVTKFLREITAKIKEAMPGAKVSDEKPRPAECSGAIKFAIPETPIFGSILIHPISPRKHWDLPTPPDQRFHLPHLGLMITTYYRPQEPGASDDTSPERASIRKAVMQAMESLIKLDRSADR
ncbi:MAG: hypothetical protein QOE70_5594 [Chthoniobacter sp.]|nr:hypothetical protein [Chthoniobacter sp.]